jgi:murein DD-endopeptidase MepM/ murein hydrolase activator NlpD
MRRALLVIGSMAVVGTATWWVAHDHIRTAVHDLLRPPSPHALYARRLEAAGLHETALGRTWLASASTVLTSGRRVTLPFTADTDFDEARPAAVAWTFSASRGRRLALEVEYPEPDATLFVDLFEIDDGKTRLVGSARQRHTSVTREVVRDGTFVLRVQPELLRGGRVTVRQRALATLQFPVSGLDAREVRSVFGDARDRGVRRHEGVDIFAPRGTPVLAASDGWITRVTTNRLGGKVVWQWDAARGQALYYAHLDRQEVSAGDRVRAGDLVGRVGNTGNAATTSAHLHFGIYRPIEGAIDPLPFICDAPCPRRGMAYAQQR